MNGDSKKRVNKAPNILGWEDVAKSFPAKSGRTTRQRNLISTLSRINSRFKLARALTEVQADGISEETRLAYTQLVRVELAFGATEAFAFFLAQECGVNLLREEQSKPAVSYDKLGQLYYESGWLDTARMDGVRSADSNGELGLHLQTDVGLSPGIKPYVKEFFDGSDKKFIFLSAAIRHVFTHGSLTADAGGFGARKANRVYCLVSQTLLDCLEREFQARTATFVQLVHAA